jgi:hypothetical protein
MRLTYLDLSVSALKKCNANAHHRSTKEEKHCVAQQPPSHRVPQYVRANVNIGMNKPIAHARNLRPRYFLKMVPG